MSSSCQGDLLWDSILISFSRYPNRDSTPYRERYNIPEAQNLVRGTLRYGCFTEFIRVLVDTGFLSDDKVDLLSSQNEKPPTWAEATARIVGASSASREDIVSAVSSKTKFNE